MIRPGDAYPPDGRPERGPLADSFLRELARPVPAPDMTRSIMGRLGYMRVSPAVARRHRRQAWARRGLLVVALAATTLMGLETRRQGPDVRRPEGPTVPGAFGSDLQEHQERFSRTIQMIRGLAPAVPATPEAAPEPPAEDDPFPAIEESIDRSAVGPMRWV
ncbi:MAG: hypothetical protein GY715_14035 [Planctomycetes bacterium]|nr:hypothetical protein [Planctomycetota bacterium]